MSVTGSFRELELLRQRIASIAGTQFQFEMSERLAWEARQQADIGFKRGIDPYDNPWEPLKYRTGKPLDDEGHLRRTITGPARVTPQGFVISTRGGGAFASVRYADTHYRGRTIRAKTAKGMRFRTGGTSRLNGPIWARAQVVTIPKRQFMPEGYLGPRWRAAFERQADDVLRRHMKGVI